MSTLEQAYALGVKPLSELQNSILVEIFHANKALDPGEIFAAVSMEFTPDALIALTRATAQLEEHGLLIGDIQLRFSLTTKGRLHLLGLLLWSGVIADQGRGIPAIDSLRVGNGADSVESAPIRGVAAEEERVQRVMSAIEKQREGKVLSFPEKVALKKFNQNVDRRHLRADEDGDGGAA